MNNVISLEGVSVYAVMENGVLAGTTPDGKANLTQDGYAAESIGDRRKDSEYFLFQIDIRDLEKLSPDIDIIYNDGKETIAKVDGEIDYSSFALVQRLLHIPFLPLPKVEHPAPPRIFDFLDDSQLDAIVNQVSQAQCSTYVKRLQDFGTRYSPHDSCRAAEQWAFNTFEDMGLETQLFPYYVQRDTWYNPVGKKVGVLYPDSIYIIIAHIDAISLIPNISAPGAEDNGSGSACVLEAARILSHYDFDCTIEFVLVSGEEQGLYGSHAYAYDCYINNRNIAGVLNFDMISYDGGYGWDINIFADENFQAERDLADLLAQLTDDYSDTDTVRIDTDGPVYASDHYWFSYYGFPAPFAIDSPDRDAPDWYPQYHTIFDLISNLDLDFGTEVVKGAVATIATIAGVQPCQTFIVNPDGMGDFPTIQAAINAAGDCDTILMADGIFTGIGNRDIDFLGKAITLLSQSGDPTQCIIDCQNAGRGFYFNSGEVSSSVVEGITVEDGYSSGNGGGVYCNLSSPTFNECVIQSGWVDGYGGGLYCYASSPTFTNCMIVSNFAGDGGGGVSCALSSPAFNNCMITFNSTDGSGGGVRCSQSSPAFSGGEIHSCSAGENGGGVYCNRSSPTFNNSDIHKNTANSDGGGVYCYRSSPVFANCVIRRDSVDGDGGGIYCLDSDPTIQNCVIDSCSADDSNGYGGGIYCDDSDPVIDSCAIHQNRACYGWGVSCINSSPKLTRCTISRRDSGLVAIPYNSRGGGLYCVHASSPELTECIISRTIAAAGKGVYCDTSSSPILSHCTIECSQSVVYCNSSSPTLNSCIIARTASGCGIQFSNSPEAVVEYCDVFGNNDNDFCGDVPPGLGELVKVNYNGDSCDFAFNISCDPLFEDRENRNYHITWDNYPSWDSTRSCCIDAGYPGESIAFDDCQFKGESGSIHQNVDDDFENDRTPKDRDFGDWPRGESWPLGENLRDPDNTLPDIGAYYFDQSTRGIQCSIGDEQIKRTIPAEYSLSQNYPNPFNPTTTIQYALPHPGQVRLAVYNIVGQQVAVLVNENQQAGTYTVQFDGSNLPSGLYFSRLTAGNYTESKKMMLLK
ncbi:M28 family peptidase [bacterium]|nr:M28 family peptidase [bacterium]